MNPPRSIEFPARIVSRGQISFIFNRESISDWRFIYCLSNEKNRTVERRKPRITRFIAISRDRNVNAPRDLFSEIRSFFFPRNVTHLHFARKYIIFLSFFFFSAVLSRRGRKKARIARATSSTREREREREMEGRLRSARHVASFSFFVKSARNADKSIRCATARGDEK